LDKEQKLELFVLRFLIYSLSKFLLEVFMWPISDLKKRFDKYLEDYAFKTEMADKPHLPV